MGGVFSGIETATSFTAFVTAVNFTCWCMLDRHLEPSSRVLAFQDSPYRLMHEFCTQNEPTPEPKTVQEYSLYK